MLLRASSLHQSERHFFESAQKQLSTWSHGPTLRISCIHLAQWLSTCLQGPAGHKLQQHQYSQTDAQQAHQADYMIFALQVHRLYRQRFPFQALEAPFYRVVGAVLSHRCREIQRVGLRVCAVHPPPQAPHGFIQGNLVHTSFDFSVVFYFLPRSTSPITSHISFHAPLSIAKVQQTGYPVFIEEFLDLFLQTLHLSVAFLSSLSFVEGKDGCEPLVELLPQFRLGVMSLLMTRWFLGLEAKRVLAGRWTTQPLRSLS